MTGDDSVNAGGLDVTAAVTFTVVASVVIASAIASVDFVVDACAATSVVVALFWEEWGFLP